MSRRMTFALALVVTGCQNGPGDPVLPRADFALVTTSGGFAAGTGAINTVKLSDHSVVRGIDTTIDQDNGVRIAGGKAYILDRSHGAVRVYDPTNWRAPVEMPTGDAAIRHDFSNPHDILPVPGTSKLYVTLYGNDAAHAVGVIDTARDHGIGKWIAVPQSAADPDGKPEANALYFCKGLIYVTLDDIDFGPMPTFAPTGNGRIAVIDPMSERTTDVIQLAGQNPYVMVAASSECEDILVSDSGTYTRLPDGTGGIEHVNLIQKRSLGLILRDIELGGRPASVEVATRAVAFSIVFFDFRSTMFGLFPVSSKVVAFNPQPPRLIGDVTDPAGTVTFARVAPSGELYVGVQTFAPPPPGNLGAGLYIGSATGTKLGTTAIDLGQNPYGIAFY